MKMTWKKWSTLLGAVAVMGIAGCADNNNNGQPDSTATAPEMDRSMEKVGNTVENAADKAATVGTNAVITGKINAAYAANASLSALKINVNTTESNKTVTLLGTVTNATQKNLAANIAKQNAPGYKIVNNLKVSGGASPKMNKKG